MTEQRDVVSVLGQPPDEPCGLCAEGVPMNPAGTAHRLGGNDMVDFACTRLNADSLHRALHTLWTKAVRQPGYSKQEWVELERRLQMLQSAMKHLGEREQQAWERVTLLAQNPHLAEREACCVLMCGFCHQAANGGPATPAQLAPGGGIYLHKRQDPGGGTSDVYCRADAIRRGRT